MLLKQTFPPDDRQDMARNPSLPYFLQGLLAKEQEGY
jgi:hypothetical protein